MTSPTKKSETGAHPPARNAGDDAHSARNSATGLDARFPSEHAQITRLSPSRVEVVPFTAEEYRRMDARRRRDYRAAEILQVLIDATPKRRLRRR